MTPRLVSDTRQLAHLVFDTYTDAIAFASDKRSQSTANSLDRDFTGTRTYQEAHQLAVAGWPAGRAKLERLAADIVTPGRVTRPEVVFDVCGDGGVDVGRALAGHPECVFDWRDTDQVAASQNGPIVRIAFNPAVSGAVGAAAIEYRGAAVLALIDALEAGGRRVELVIEKVNSISSHDRHVGRNFRITIPLKSADHQAQPDQIAFALLHPSMNRRMMFSITAQCGMNGRAAAGIGYGGRTDYTPADYDVWIPRLDMNIHTGEVPDFGSQDAAARWVFARLAAAGVTVNQGGN